MNEQETKDLDERLIGRAYTVHRALGVSAADRAAAGDIASIAQAIALDRIARALVAHAPNVTDPITQSVDPERAALALAMMGVSAADCEAQDKAAHKATLAQSRALATDGELMEIYDEAPGDRAGLRAVYNLGRKHGGVV